MRWSGFFAEAPLEDAALFAIARAGDMFPRQTNYDPSTAEKIMRQYWLTVLVVATLASGSMYYARTRPISPCENGHCPNEDRPEYRHALQHAAEKARVAKASAPKYAAFTFIFVCVVGVGWRVKRMTRP